MKMNTLAKYNSHVRDINIIFQENGHKYTVTTDIESNYTSVTTWIHSLFPKFDADVVIRNMMRGKNWKEGHKYWGLPTKQIKDIWEKTRVSAASAGTTMHYNIECFMNSLDFSGYTHKELYDLNHSQKQEVEWIYFLKFVKDFPELKPFRTEWMIYCEETKLSGSIDMVYENPDGTLSIYDWKRSAHITKINTWNKYATSKCIDHLPDSNFWYYAIQLNTYKSILEKNYDKKVTRLCLVRLHPDSTSYELLDVPILEKEISNLFEERKKELYK